MVQFNFHFNQGEPELWGILQLFRRKWSIDYSLEDQGIFRSSDYLLDDQGIFRFPDSKKKIENTHH